MDYLNISLKTRFSRLATVRRTLNEYLSKEYDASDRIKAIENVRYYASDRIKAIENVKYDALDRIKAIENVKYDASDRIKAV